MLKGEEPLATLKLFTSFVIIKTALSATAMQYIRPCSWYAINQDQLCEISLTTGT